MATARGKAGPGECIAGYRIEAELGAGGMGRVFRAASPEGDAVALKVIRPELAGGEASRRRFEREARAAQRVSHRHVVPVLDGGEHKGAPYLVYRYMGGGSLSDLIDRRGRLQLDVSVRVCLEVAAGLDALHAEGIVHRDVKPANILFDDTGKASIADLGLVKITGASMLTRPGAAVGSMFYMAPEQVRGEEVTGATDVYGLGCVTYTCLAGRPPFADREGMRVLWAHLQEDPGDPCAERGDAPGDLGWAAGRALEKEPVDRPRTATSYARMLQVAAGLAGERP